jgi:hypothetical protein
MIRVLLLVLLFGLPSALQAQTVSGTVVDKESGLPVKGVQITAVNDANAKTVTDAQGRFTLSGTGGESFYIAAPGYAQQIRRAPELVGNVPWRIQLQLFSVSLGEVRVRPFSEGYQLDSFSRVKTYERALARQRSGGMSPVSFLAERISPKQRRLFAFQNDFARMEDEKFIDSRYTPELTAEMTKLSGDSLAHFMNQNPMPYDFARAATDLEIKMWIKDRYKSWKSN